MVRYLFYTIGDLTYQSPLVVVPQLVNQFQHFLKPERLLLFHKDGRLSLSCAKYPGPRRPSLFL